MQHCAHIACLCCCGACSVYCICWACLYTACAYILHDAVLTVHMESSLSHVENMAQQQGLLLLHGLQGQLAGHACSTLTSDVCWHVCKNAQNWLETPQKGLIIRTMEDHEHPAQAQCSDCSVMQAKHDYNHAIIVKAAYAKYRFTKQQQPVGCPLFPSSAPQPVSLHSCYTVESACTGIMP